MCRGRQGEEGWGGGEQRGSGDGAGHFAEIALKAAASPGLVLIAQTHFGVLLKAPALAGNASVPSSCNKNLSPLLLHGGISQSWCNTKDTHHVPLFLWQYLVHTLSGHQLYYQL